jgi:hypothetical protein
MQVMVTIGSQTGPLVVVIDLVFLSSEEAQLVTYQDFFTRVAAIAVS